MTVNTGKRFMNKLERKIQALVTLIAALAFCAGISAQESHQKRTVQTKYNGQRSPSRFAELNRYDDNPRSAFTGQLPSLCSAPDLQLPRAFPDGDGICNLNA